jgi:hypothetical protein
MALTKGAVLRGVYRPTTEPRRIFAAARQARLEFDRNGRSTNQEALPMSSKFLPIGALSLVLVIAAIAVPSASARPADQFLNSQPTSAATARPEVVANPDQQQASSSGLAYITPASAYPPGQRAAALSRGAASSAPTQVRVAASPPAGFDWADAGIGAGAAFALTMIGLGAAVLLSNRRHDHGRPATAV